MSTRTEKDPLERVWFYSTGNLALFRRRNAGVFTVLCPTVAFHTGAFESVILEGHSRRVIGLLAR
jgi:hypothetical protein